MIAISMAGELGFEPRLTESESAVLPLNYSPKAFDLPRLFCVTQKGAGLRIASLYVSKRA
jgi:hypothetical protein